MSAHPLTHISRWEPAGYEQRLKPAATNAGLGWS